jgi:Flp pilus assembly protein TadG
MSGRVLAGWRRLRAGTDGAALVEFAVVSPVLLTLILALIDVGRMYYVRQSLEFATQEGARYYRLNPTAASSTVTTFLKAKMAGGMGTGVSVAYADTANCNGNASVTCTVITASYSFSPVTAYLGIGTTSLQARSQAVRY